MKLGRGTAVEVKLEFQQIFRKKHKKFDFKH